jgi:thymidylate synthase ThyX
MERAASLYRDLLPRLPDQAAYAVALAFRVRYVMQMNAREAMHLLELRSGPQGHASYRWVAQEMHRLIAGQAGHRLLAEAMSYVDFSAEDLERLESERRAEDKRNSMSAAGNPVIR